MKIRFYLRESRSTITVSVHFGPHRLMLGTGVSIPPKQWSATRGRAKRGYASEAATNAALESIERKIVDEYYRLVASGEPVTPELMKGALRKKKEEVAKARVKVLDAYKQFIADAEGRLQPASIAVHKTAMGHLKGFAKAYSGSFRLSWESFTSLFFEKFGQYLSKVVELNNTSMWKVLSTVRTFIQWAYEQGYTANTDYQKFTRRKIPKGEKSVPVYLDQAEISALTELDLSADARLARVRDVFIFQLHTGMRYSDIQAIRPEHVRGETISLVTQKNRKAVAIPLLPEAQRIWDQYGGDLPVISNQKQNKYLKELMQKAGIDTLQIVTDYRGSERIERTVAKSELIGTHSAKRTFVTILRQRGVSIESICKITGNSRRTIETYIVGTSDDAVREVRAMMT